MSSDLYAPRKESLLLKRSIAGLLDTLGELAAPRGEEPITVLHLAGDYALREHLRQKGKISFPFIALFVTSIDERLDGRNHVALHKQGIAVNADLDDSANTRTILKAKGITLNFRCVYFTESFENVIDLTQRWLLRGREVQFTLENEGLTINIKVLLDKNLTIPQIQFEEYGTLFNYELTGSMESYVAELETEVVIRSIKLDTQLWSESEQTVVAGSREEFTRRRKQE